MRRTHVRVGLSATLTLFSVLFVATAVLGHTKRTVVRDALNPNRDGDCDIRKATGPGHQERARGPTQRDGAGSVAAL